jgi:branched-chain amino acid transport system substrate-binding protein
MRMRGSLQITMLAVAGIVFMLSGNTAEAAKLEGRNVKIGCMVPLTGKGAEWGQTAKHGMEIAVEEINKKGGVGGLPIQLICYDTQTLESEGLKVVSRLVERDKVLAISGPCFSSVFETIAPQLDGRLKTVINSYCSSKPGLSALSKWAFRNTLTSDKQLKPVVKAWVEEYKPKKVVIIYDAEDAVSKAEGDKIMPVLLKENGVEVLEKLTYRTKDTDYSAQVTKAKSLGAEGIAFGSCYQNAAAIAKEAHKQGLKVPMVGGACASAPGFIEIGGKAAEGTIITTSLDRDSTVPITRSFITEYEKMSGQKADMVSASAHTAVHVMAAALKKAGKVDPAAVRAAIAATKLKVSTGTISFNALGEVRKDVQVQIVKGGAWHRHSVISDDKLLAPPTK